MKLDNIFNKYKHLLSEEFQSSIPPAGTQQAPPPTQGIEQAPPEESQLPDAANPQDMNTGEESPEELEENEKLLVDILLKIVGVLKDYYIANGSQNADKIDALIKTTRDGIKGAKNINDILTNFIKEFDATFEEHIEKTVE